MSAGKTEASIYQQAEDGKTELSLMHFAITNPKWQPPRESTAFIGFLKERVHRDSSVALAQQAVLPENALFSSIQSLQSESEVPRLGGNVERSWSVCWVLAKCNNQAFRLCPYLGCVQGCKYDESALPGTNSVFLGKGNWVSCAL